jgi:hypothetical protein
MNLPPIETILFKYMLSPAFLELSGHPDMDLIPCSKRLIVVSSMFFSMDSSQLVKSDHKRKSIGIINDVHHPYSCGEVRLRASKQDGPTVSLGECILPIFIQIQLCDKIVQKS